MVFKTLYYNLIVYDKDYDCIFKTLRLTTAHQTFSISITMQLSELFVKKKEYEIHTAVNRSKMLRNRLQHARKQRQKVLHAFAEVEYFDAKSSLEAETKNAYLQSLIEEAKAIDDEIDLLGGELEKNQTLLKEHIAEKNGLETYKKRVALRKKKNESYKEDQTANEIYSRKFHNFD